MTYFPALNLGQLKEDWVLVNDNNPELVSGAVAASGVGFAAELAVEVPACFFDELRPLAANNGKPASPELLPEKTSDGALVVLVKLDFVLEAVSALDIGLSSNDIGNGDGPLA